MTRIITKMAILALLYLATTANALSQSSDSLFVAEFEDGILGGDAEIISSCSSSSQGKFVRMLEATPGTSVSFENVEVPEAGKYLLDINFYHGGGATTLELMVNGEANYLDFPNVNWCYQGPSSSKVALIQLNAGVNTLAFYPFGDIRAPLLDHFAVRYPKVYEVSFDLEYRRMLKDDSISVFVSTDETLPGEETFSIAVDGLNADQYQLSTSVFKINAGEESASFGFKSLGASGACTLQITNLSSGLKTGTRSTTNLNIVESPQNFYISSSEGDDSNDGSTPATAFKSLEKISNTYLVAGDSVLFKRGDVFNGQLRVNGSGNPDMSVVVSAYGTGDKPLIDGAAGELGSYVTAVLIENQDHIMLSDLAITNDRSQPMEGEPDDKAHGIWLQNSSDRTMNHIRFNNLDINGVFAYQSPDPAGSAFRIHCDKNFSEEGARNINDIIIENCYIANIASYGMVIGHQGGAGADSLMRNSNIIIRNNHFFQTGGSSILPAKVYNCLIENNIFEYPGSNADPRMKARGSALWFFNSRNGIVQNNVSLHVRGEGDSYGYHIDYNNKNIIFQYNYSEDAEGGFVEVLGNNKNVGYRYNVSVNDGFRSNAKTFWMSGYAGSSNDKIPSDSVYVYNNTIYLGNNQSTGISLSKGSMFLYNNIIYADEGAQIGSVVSILEEEGREIVNHNNLYFGDISPSFIERDSIPILADPLYYKASDLSADNYKITEGSPALNQSRNEMPGLKFPMAGKGIFKNITEEPTVDYFGNPVDFNNNPHLGAFNGTPGMAFIYPLVKIMVSKNELNPGDTITVQAIIDKSITEDQTVDLMISEELLGKYSLSESFITISKDGLSGSVQFSSLATNDNAEDVTGTLFLANPSREIRLGENIEESITLLKLVVLGTEDLMETALNLYPNPVINRMQIMTNTGIEKIELITLSGIIKPLEVSEDGIYDVSLLTKGMYILRTVNQKGEIKITRFLKK